MKKSNTNEKLPEEAALAPAEPKQPSLLDQIGKRGIEPGQYHTLANSLFPGADPQSVLMVIDYCQARGLDPMKKPCHIVPMKVKDAKTGVESWRDVVMPGIYEYRTTAQKTGEYLGQGKTEYGPEIDYKGLKTPDSCTVTVYRWNSKAKQRAEYITTVWFSEVVAESWKRGEKGVKEPNARWKKAPRQMLTKCTEAAALRMAFPDELGGEMTVEEMGSTPHQDHGIKDVEQLADDSESPRNKQTKALLVALTNKSEEGEKSESN